MDPSENVRKRTGHIRQTLSVLCGTLGSFGLGAVLGWSSPGLPSLVESRDLGDLSPTEQSWIASIAILGAFFSGPVAGVLNNRIGRRGTMTLLSVPFSGGWALMACSKVVPSLLYVGRFLTGLCGGAFTVIIPVYVSEIVDESMKGVMGSLMVLMLVSGILFSFVLGAVVSWFNLTVVCGFVPVFLLLGTFFIPETPQHLLSVGESKKAEGVLRWLSGLEKDELGITCTDSLHKISHVETTTSQNESEDNGRNSTINAIKSPYIAKPVLICIALICFQQLGGINGVTMYTVDIFKSASESLDANLACILIGVVQVVFVTVSVSLVDKLGRKALLCSSSIIMGLSLLGLGLFFHLKAGNNGVAPQAFTNLPILTLVSYIVAYSFGMGPIPWLLVSELLNPELRSELSAVITFVYWTLAFVGTKTYQDMISVFGEAMSYWIFGAVCFSAAFFTHFYVPETKGKSALEIRRYFGDEAVLDVERDNALEEER